MRKLVAGVLLFLAASVPAGAASAAYGGETAAPAGEKGPSVNFSADPRIELLAAVQLLSGYGDTGLLTWFDFPYKRRVRSHFARFKGHTAVKLFAEMSRKGFNYSAPPTAVLHLSRPPALEEEVIFGKFVLERAGGRKRLEEFVGELRNFAVETDFMKFYDTNRGEYDRMVRAARSKFDAKDISALEDYFGITQRSYNIILAPLFHQGGYGPRIEAAGGGHDIFNVCGPRRVSNRLPDFGDAEEWRYLVWHELAHSFVNPTTELFKKDLMPYCDFLAAPIKREAAAMGMKPGDTPWVTDEVMMAECVDETVVRAFTVRLAHLKFGPEAGGRALQGEKHKGWSFVEPVAKCLERYEKERDRYPTIKDFYPEIIKVFARLAGAEGT